MNIAVMAEVKAIGAPWGPVGLETKANPGLCQLGRARNRARRLDGMGGDACGGAAPQGRALRQLRHQWPRHFFCGGKPCLPAHVERSGGFRARPRDGGQRARPLARADQGECGVENRSPWMGMTSDEQLMAKAAEAGGDLPIAALGSGSDYTPFLQHLGIAALSIGYAGGRGGLDLPLHLRFVPTTTFVLATQFRLLRSPGARPPERIVLRARRRPSGACR